MDHECPICSNITVPVLVWHLAFILILPSNVLQLLSEGQVKAVNLITSTVPPLKANGEYWKSPDVKSSEKARSVTGTLLLIMLQIVVF